MSETDHALPEPIETQVCRYCGNLFPKLAEHFRVTKHGNLATICKTCYRDRKRVRKRHEHQARKNKMAAIEGSAVDLYAKLATTGGSNIPHSAELVEKICQYFGGVSGFAAIMVKQYWDADPGSSARNRLLETVCRLVQSNVDSGGAKKPLSLWSEDELEAELAERFRLAVLQNKVLLDGKIPSPAPAAGHPDDSGDDAAPVRAIESDPGGTERAETGGPEPVQPDCPAGGDSPLPSE